MTKKDYDLIAACIGAAQANYSKYPEATYGRDDLVDRLISEMKLDNPRFNESKFWERVEYWRKQHGGL